MPLESFIFIGFVFTTCSFFFVVAGELWFNKQKKREGSSLDLEFGRGKKVYNHAHCILSVNCNLHACAIVRCGFKLLASTWFQACICTHSEIGILELKLIPDALLVQLNIVLKALIEAP